MVSRTLGGTEWAWTSIGMRSDIINNSTSLVGADPCHLHRRSNFRRIDESHAIIDNVALVMKVLPEQIAATLSDRVIHGSYPPGHRLIEAALSQEFGVSHGPIRDALRILQASGLVTIHPYRGARVTQLSVREVRELYEVRAALVSIRARWIAEDPQPHRAKILELVEARIARLAALADDEQNAEEFSDESAAVNNLLTDSLPNRWLRSTIQAITLQTSRYSRLALVGSRERRQEAAQLW